MRLVNNVLDLSRLEAGMMKFQMSNYDIVQLCNDAVGMAHMQNSTLHTHFISNIDEYIIHTDTKPVHAIRCQYSNLSIRFFQRRT